MLSVLPCSSFLLSHGALTPAAPFISLSGDPLERIAFGSCNKQTKPQHHWQVIENTTAPQLFIFHGERPDPVLGGANESARIAFHTALSTRRVQHALLLQLRVRAPPPCAKTCDVVYAKPTVPELAKAFDTQSAHSEYTAFRRRLQGRMQCWPSGARGTLPLSQYVMPAVWDDHDLGINDGGAA